MFVSPILFITVKSLYFFFYYIYNIYSNDEIEKEISSCITKGEQVCSLKFHVTR